MKKIILLLILCVFFKIPANAQRYKYAHSKGLTGIGVSGGISENGNFVELGMTEFFNVNKKGFGSINYEWGKIGLSDYSVISLATSYYYTVFEWNRNFYAGIGTGALINYETLKNEFLNEKENNITPGLLLGVDLEYSLKKGFAITAGFQQNYRFNSNIGDFYYNIKIGMTCYL